MASSYGLLHRLETEILRRAGASHDLDLVDAILAGLAADCTSARMGWHAEQSQALRGYAVVAAGVLQRFEAAAAAIGSSNWLAIDAMLDAALNSPLRIPDPGVCRPSRCQRSGTLPRWTG